MRARDTKAAMMVMAMAMGLPTEPIVRALDRPARQPRRMANGGWFTDAPVSVSEQITNRTKRLAKEKRRAKTKAAKDARRRNRR